MVEKARVQARGGGLSEEISRKDLTPWGNGSRLTPMETIAVYGTKGGAGTTTVAAAIAIVRQGTLRSPDAAPILGRPGDEGEVVVGDGSGPIVEDRGVLTQDNGPADGETAILVTRLCYLALRTAHRKDLSNFRGFVSVTEPGRALSEYDAKNVLGLPCLASVSWEPSVARAVDSGLLEARLPVTLRRAVTLLRAERI